MEKVAVVFDLFGDYRTPAEAARSTLRRFTYEAPADWNLTIGDRIMVPVGDKYRDYDVRPATVV